MVIGEPETSAGTILALTASLATQLATYIFLANDPCTVGDLIDFANNVPGDMLDTMAAAFAAWLFQSDTQDMRKRHLVVLGALLNRLIWEREGIPARRDAQI